MTKEFYIMMLSEYERARRVMLRARVYSYSMDKFYLERIEFYRTKMMEVK